MWSSLKASYVTSVQAGVDLGSEEGLEWIAADGGRAWRGDLRWSGRPLTSRARSEYEPVDARLPGHDDTVWGAQDVSRHVALHTGSLSRRYQRTLWWYSEGR